MYMPIFFLPWLMSLSECFVPFTSAEVLTNRIVDGTDAAEGEFPYAVSLRYNSKHTCGGTILSEKYILTAAHCVCRNDEPRDPQNYTIQYDMLKISEEDVNTIQVSEINCHDFNVEKLTYDSAVLELDSPLPQGKWKPVKIAKDFTPSEGQKGTIIGWGRISHMGPISKTLQKIEVEVYDENTCGKKFDKEHHICLGAPPLGGACNGDSGTALIVDGVQVGIASFITNICGTSNKRYPNVYSRVSSYYDWIHSVAIDL